MEGRDAPPYSGSFIFSVFLRTNQQYVTHIAGNDGIDKMVSDYLLTSTGSDAL